MNKIFLVLILLIKSLTLSANNSDTLIYVGDPMCSWCYGFMPELIKVKEHYANLPFKMVMGGLRVGGNESMEELSDFLYKHWQEVSKASNQKFNFSIFKNANFYYDTEPACRSVSLIKALYPNRAFEYFEKLQIAFYQHNQDPTELLTYKNILEMMKIETVQFEKLFKKGSTKELVMEDFDYAKSLGVTSFPALILKRNNKFYRVTSGYAKAEKIISILEDRGVKN